LEALQPNPHRFRQSLYKIYCRLSLWKRVISHRWSPVGKLWLGLTLVATLPGLNTRLTLAYQLVSLLVGFVLVSAGLSKMGFSQRKAKLQRNIKGYATALTPFHYTISLPAGESPSCPFISDDLQLVFPTFSDWKHQCAKTKVNIFDRFMGYRCFSSMLKTINPDISLGEQGELINGVWHVHLTLHFPRRGLFKWKYCRILENEALGLMRSARSIPCEQDILVLPPRFHIPHFTLPSRGARLHQPKSRSSQVGQQGDFSALREYHHGDSLKHIHWRSSAKTGELRVMEYQEEQSQRTAIVLEPQAEELEHFEVCVALAASFCQQLPSEKMQVDLLFIAQTCHQISCGRQYGPSIAALKALAEVSPQEDLGHCKLKHTLFNHLDLVSSLIFITSVWDKPQWELCRAIVNNGIPLMVLWVSEEEPISLGPFEHSPQRFIKIQPHSVLEDLARLGKAT
jgi:hypothetical protein